MKPKTTLILALVLLVLVAIAALFEKSRRQGMSSAGKPIFPAFSLAKADAITVLGGDEHHHLVKPGETWLVATEGNHPADPKIPTQLLEALDKFSTSTLISTVPEKHAAFEVDSTGYRVQIDGGGKTLAAFMVGKPGPDFMSTYVRPVDQDAVYLVPVYLRTAVDRGETSWRNHMMLEVEQADITGYTTRNEKETVTVEKEPDGTWRITEPVEAQAKPDIVSIVLRSLASIRASGFADSLVTPADVGLDADTARVVLRTVDGSSHTLIVGTTNASNQSHCQKAGDSIIYLVPRGRWNTIFRPVETLRMEEAEAPSLEGPEGAS